MASSMAAAVLRRRSWHVWCAGRKRRQQVGEVKATRASHDRQQARTGGVQRWEQRLVRETESNAIKQDARLDPNERTSRLGLRQRGIGVGLAAALPQTVAPSLVLRRLGDVFLPTSAALAMEAEAPRAVGLRPRGRRSTIHAAAHRGGEFLGPRLQALRDTDRPWVRAKPASGVSAVGVRCAVVSASGQRNVLALVDAVEAEMQWR